MQYRVRGGCPCAAPLLVHFSSSSSLITTARLAALLRAETIAIAIAAAVAEGSADAFLVVVPAGQGLCLVLAVAVVALVAAHIAVDVVCEWSKQVNPTL